MRRSAKGYELLEVYSFITHEHDLQLVMLAGCICVLSAFTASALFDQARAPGRRRIAWIGLTGFVSGTGIWATHFVAMLAYDPHLPIGYDLTWTLLSIALAIGITGAGWWIALRRHALAPAGGGAAIGAGIAVMHYTGMSAVTVPGYILWNYWLVAASVAVAVVLGAAALVAQARDSRMLPWRSASLLTLAICGLHFIGMTAASILPDPRVAVPSGGIDTDTLTVAVTAMALLILTISIGLVGFDRRLARIAIEEARRLRTFADAAVEGLVVIDGDRVVDVNASFLKLSGFAALASVPTRVPTLFPGLEMAAMALDADASALESRLVKADGKECDVELLLRRIEWQGEVLRALAVRDITERKEASARIAHLAYHDALTGLPNRAVHSEHLAGAVARAALTETTVTAFCIDLDGFKAVNDIHGHPAGDELLVEVAHRLRSAIRGRDMVARLGGDEFGVIQYGGTQPGHAGMVAERIIKALEKPIRIGAATVRIGASIGVALFPADADNPADLIKNADIALYRAKTDGRGGVRFYEAAMDEALRQRRQVKADLGQSIDNGELGVHYQPLVDLGSGEVIGFEALARWTHPVRGTIPPDIFVPLAEESGFIVRLGAWVLREAAAEAAGWPSSLTLSVNVSPGQFEHGDLAAEVEHVLAESGLDAARLDLEVTEGLLIKDAEHAIAALHRLKRLGVRISMDDFGTGYSSLSYFRIFPFDRVKIDQSFVHDMLGNPQSRAIIRSVIGLGHDLGMLVVAEGVETQEQLDALRADGCNQAQGYLISPPYPIGCFDRVVLAVPPHLAAGRLEAA